VRSKSNAMSKDHLLKEDKRALASFNIKFIVILEFTEDHIDSVTDKVILNSCPFTFFYFNK
jgi:hypothetical protein